MTTFREAFQPVTDHTPADARRLLPAAILWIALGVLPWLAYYVAHFARSSEEGGVATGFVQYDMPYYVACGRDVFERGNGLTYPNPYDASTNPEPIYFHWLIWLLGFGVAIVGVPPAAWFLAIGVAGAVATASITWRLIGRIVPERDRGWSYLLAMWGGGGLVLAAILRNLIAGQPAFEDILRYDPAGGYWFLNWGRNLDYPTEAVYHALVAGAWLGIIAGRSWIAVALIGLLAATHPFSGAQHLLILVAWFGLRAVIGRDRDSIGPFLTTCGIALAFGYYYMLYLPAFPQHAEIVHAWKLDWSLMPSSALLAYGPVAGLATIRLVRQWRSCGGGAIWGHDGFFLLAAMVSFALANHDKLMTPTQPLHFTRGYVWMPLFLIGLPLLPSLVRSIRSRLPALAASVVLTSLFLAGVSDNAFWLRESTRRPFGVRLTAGQERLFDEVDQRRLAGVALAPVEFSYLLATYTQLTPYLGHMYLTPDGAEKSMRAEAFLSGTADPPPVDWLILPRAEATRLSDRLDDFGFELATSEFIVLKRR
ncbi:MAG: hypothetical protein WBC44_16375 [Planctomycetaceae bacterium]